MKLIVCEDYKELSKKAAEIVAEQIEKKPDSVLGLATGSTPVGMYQELSEMNKKGIIDFEKVVSYNLDEYYPIDDSNPQSYHYFMNENLFSKINIKISNTHLLNGRCYDTIKECEEYEEKISESGGIDLQILGIGQNGHIGFNEPDINLCSKTHLTNLTESTINANSRFFESADEVPKQALTMGIGTILNARKIILLASGASKHKAVLKLLDEAISTDNPASMLKVHPDVILICDREAFSSDRIGVDIGGSEIKFGVLNERNEIVYKESIATDCKSEESLLSQIAEKCLEIRKSFHITGVGIGTPGKIKDGKVSAVNLPFKETDIKGFLKSRLNLPVKVSNDANCAALGEAAIGAGKAAKNLVMITLGTGIGGGIIINGKIYEGRGSAGEIGHMCIDFSGKECSCGLKGCWERYASAAALVKIAENMAKSEPESYLAKLFNENGKLNGKLFFEAVKKDCPAAKKVFGAYLTYLAAGINSIINIFEPDMIVLSGGITNVGELLTEPLKKKITGDVPIEISILKNDAGIAGAALLN